MPRKTLLRVNPLALPLMPMTARTILEFVVRGPFLVGSIVLGVILTAIDVDRILGLSSFPPGLFSLLFMLPLIGGLSLVWVSGRLLFLNGRGMPYGDVVNSVQTRQLVIRGPYRYTRNPMILGYLLVLIAIGMYLRSVTGMLLVPFVALCLLSGWVKLVEEKRLEGRFGKEYREYRRKVPFLLPVEMKASGISQTAMGTD